MPRRPVLALIALSGFLLAAPWGLRRLDPALLRLGVDRPWLWAEAALAAPAAVGGLWLAWAWGRARTRRALYLLLALAALARFGLPPLLRRAAPDPLPALRARSGVDLGALQRGMVRLTAALARRLPPDARVALVHRRRQPDLPVFVGFLLAPRVFFLFPEAPPPPATRQRLGIRWILDVRRADHRRAYRDAVLRRVEP